MSADETRNIKISVNTNGNSVLNGLADQLGGINQSTKTLAQTFSSVAASFAGFLGGITLRGLASFSDEIQVLNDRLVALTGSQISATALLSQLQSVAQETNSSLEATSNTYLKLGNSLKEANLDSSQLLDLTETLINTFRLSGTSADQASVAVNSMAASFQLGGIKARDLRTIMKENTVLAQELRGAFGNNLFSAATDGFISVSKLAQVLYSNMGDVNARAQLLNATFGQSLTKALDAFKIEVFDLNQQLGLSGGFAEVAQAAATNMASIVTVGTILAVSVLPSIITKVAELSVSLLALNSSALFLIGTLGVGLVAAVALFGNSWDIGDLVTQIKVGFAELSAIIDDFEAKFDSFLAKVGQWAPSGSLAANSVKAFQDLSAAATQAAADSRAHGQALQIEADAQKALTQQQTDNANHAASNAQAVKKLAAAYKPDLTPEQLLSQLNVSFTNGAVSVSQYADAIQSVDIASAQKKFRDGKIDLEALNAAFQKNSLYQLNQDLRTGVINLSQFDDAVRNQQLDKLNQDLAAGIISLEQYNQKVASVTNEFSTNGAFTTGLQDYITAIGTSTQQVAKVITDTFNNLGDQLADFVKTGTFDFATFTQNVLDDLLKIIIRMSIIQPLAGGLLGLLPSAVGTGGTSGVGAYQPGGINAVPSAHGNVFDRGLVKFATGGVVSSPTAFGFGNGQTGLMGEAGPEAIIPLSRGSGGDLGVKASITPVTIIINNNSSADVTQSETTGPNGDKQIELLIQGKVRDGISNGKFDKAFKQSFGVSRQGT